MTKHVHAEPLSALARTILVAGGAPEAEATAVARHLVDANLAGHDSHGVGMIPTYTWSLKCGACKPEAHAELISDRGAVAVVDGKLGFGQVVGPEAMEIGVARAREHGIAAVALRNAHHLGRIGHYAEQAVAAGLISMHYVNVVGHPPQVAPFGAAEPQLNTNPYCCGVPIEGGDPIILDMATSTVALGKVREAHARGDQVPEGCLVDPQGRPTRDPSVMFGDPRGPKGALTAFGLHKGYGLSLICDLLGGALAGDWPVSRPYDGPATVYNHMLVVLLQPDAVGDPEQVHAHFSALAETMRATRPAEGVERVMVAGDPERAARIERNKHGIPLADGTWKGMLDVGERLGLDRVELEAMV